MEFETLFRKYYWIIEAKAERASKMLKEDKQDIVSYLQLHFWNEWKSYNDKKIKFKKYIDIRLERRLIDYSRNKGLEFNRNVTKLSELISKDDDGNLVEPEFEDVTVNVEIEATLETKTDEDKRQLILALTKETDSITTAIVKEFLVDKTSSPRAIGRKLGVHHQTVRRKLDALSRKYYADYSEDINEFLVV